MACEHTKLVELTLQGTTSREHVYHVVCEDDDGATYEFILKVRLEPVGVIERPIELDEHYVPAVSAQIVKAVADAENGEKLNLPLDLVA